MSEISRILRALSIVALLSLSGTAAAQTAETAQTVMKKAEAWFDEKAGMDITFEMRLLKMISFTGRMAVKGNRSYFKFDKVMLVSDGNLLYEYDEEKNTITIESVSAAKKKNSGPDIDFSKYKKCTLKEKDANYELTFSHPNEKDAPSQMVLTVSKNNCKPVEMRIRQGLIGARVLFKSIRKGVSDALFTFDIKKYPNAKVIRK